MLIHDFSDNSIRKIKTDKADSLKIANYALAFWQDLQDYSVEDETRQEQTADDVERFIAQAHKYVGLENLTPYALHELVKAIYIEAPDESSGKRRQSIHISYDFVGFIPIQELM